uniref:Transmembrane protein 256 homolog n=3 Tax=Timema TaxID=61471 RepID=A0A7R9IH91_9NEOP|nr:unnamed protein product [Timema tahoe]
MQRDHMVTTKQLPGVIRKLTDLFYPTSVQKQGQALYMARREFLCPAKSDKCCALQVQLKERESDADRNEFPDDGCNVKGVRQATTAFPNIILKPKEIIQTDKVIMSPALTNLVHSGTLFIRLAGVSGAAAVVLGAYGAHAVYPKEGSEERKKIYDMANKYHFLHTLALLGVPLCRLPILSGSLLVAGMVLFCGTCYYHALSGNTQLRGLTPVGGTLLIFGWLTMIL